MPGGMLTGKQAGQGGTPLPHPAQQAAPLAAVLQAAALPAAAAAVVLQALVVAIPVHHPAAAVEARHHAGSQWVSRWLMWHSWHVEQVLQPFVSHKSLAAEFETCEMAGTLSNAVKVVPGRLH